MTKNLIHLGLVISTVILSSLGAQAQKKKVAPAPRMLPPVIVDENGEVIKRFDSIEDALRGSNFFTFGRIQIGASYTLQTGWVNSSSTEPMVISSNLLTGSSFFSKPLDLCENRSTPPNTSCRFDIKFKPAGIGLVTALITTTFVHSTGNGTGTIDYEGTGATYTILPGNFTIDNSGNITGPNGEKITKDGDDLIGPTCKQESCAQPVNLSTGAMWHQMKDMKVSGRKSAVDLDLKRIYTSRKISVLGDFGPKWSHQFETQLLESSNGDLIWLKPDGGVNVFRYLGIEGAWGNPTGFTGSFEASGYTFRIRTRTGEIYEFSRISVLAPIGRLYRYLTQYGTAAITLTYDANEKLKSLSTPMAGTLDITRNSSGLIQRITGLRDGLYNDFTYDPSGRLATSSDVAGHITTYSYTSVGTDDAFLSQIKDPLSRTIDFTYDSAGRASSQTEHGGGSWSFQYGTDSSGRSTTTVRHPNRETKVYHFNSRLLLEQIDLPDGGIQKQTWDSSRFLATSTDELNFTTNYSFGFNTGDLLSLRKPLDSTATLYTYDFYYRTLQTITPLIGARTVNTVNLFGDITETRRPSAEEGDKFTQFTRDNFGNVLKTTNNRAAYTDVRDANGLLTTKFDTRNPETIAYDSRFRVRTRTFATGRVLTYSYDDFNRVTRIDDTHGPSEINDYDIVGRLITKTIQSGTDQQITQYQWDDRDRLTKITNALNQETKFYYDRVNPDNSISIIDKPTRIVDALGRTTSYSYDSRDRLSAKAEPNLAVTTYGYNGRGDLTSVMDALVNVTQFTYDGNSRLKLEIYPSAIIAKASPVPVSETIEHFYDVGGRRIQKDHRNADGSMMYRTTYTYDSVDRVIRKLEQEISRGVTTTLDDSNYTYQNQLDVTNLLTANNQVQQLTFDYEPKPPFKSLGFSAQSTDPNNSLGLINGSWGIIRDLTSEIKSVRRAGPDNIFMATFDPAGRLLTKNSSNYFGPTPVSIGATLSYDGFGRKSGMTFTDGTQATIVYDALNRVNNMSWTGSTNYSEALTYDAVGNITNRNREDYNRTFTYDAINQLTVMASNDPDKTGPSIVLDRTLGYDLMGNRTSDTVNGPGNFIANILASNSRYRMKTDLMGFGNLTTEERLSTGPIKNFTYNVRRQVASVERYVSSSSPITVATAYHYDALGRRVAKSFKDGSKKGYTQAFMHQAEEDRILLTKAGDGTIRVHLDGQGIDEHLAEFSASASKVYVTDHLGSVLNSELTGTRKDYGPFGELITVSIPTISNTTSPAMYGFAGRTYDLESDKYFNRARSYDPYMGRWLSKDPIGYEGGDTNLYRYAMNSPVLRYDPTGKLAPIAAIGLAIGGGAVVGGAASFVGTYIATGSFEQSLASVPAGSAGGAAAVLTSLAAAAGAVPTGVGVGTAVTVDLLVNFSLSPSALPEGTGKDLGNGIKKLLNPENPNTCTNKNSSP